MCAEDVLVSLAGHAAEKLVKPDASLEQAASDTEEARQGLRLLAQEHREHEWRAKADVFTDSHREVIGALARELMEVETIDDPFEAEIIIDVARGEASPADLEHYRAVKRHLGRGP